MGETIKLVGRGEVLMRALAVVRYRYRRQGSNGPFTSTTGSFRVLQQVETLVLQAIRHARPGCEVELTELRWKP
jgi:O-acetylhomoserine/O-acetylserine sulfhydrylase-like pyridoxal-dependent enzyme